MGLLLGISAIPMLALAGGVIDYVHIENERARLQSAVDTGVLSAMKLEDPTEADVREIVTEYLKANYHPGRKVTVDYNAMSVTISSPSNGARVIDVSVVAHVATSFWALVGINTADIRIRSEAKAGMSGLEVVLVLDNTGSMSWHGSNGQVKIEELKEAAKELINDLAGIASGNGDVKVGLVPFTSLVNVGTDKCGEPWLSDACNDPDWEGMVGLREYDFDITDGGYDTHPIPAVQSQYWMQGWYEDSNGTWWHEDGAWDDWGMPVAMMDLRALDSDTEKQELIDQVDSMVAEGWTYIPAGLAWGWRMLSAEPPFTNGVTQDVATEENVRKVVVLLTDGANTCRRKPGDPDGYTMCGGDALNRTPGGGGDRTSTEADSRLRALCENVKAANVNIISVTFDVDSDNPIKEMMEDCSNLGYYNASSGDLNDVFKDIARKLVKLHLSR